MRIAIDISSDSNPEYFAVLSQYNVLMDKWNDVNRKVLSFPHYSIYTPGRQKQLTEIGKEVHLLSEDWLKYQSNALHFYKKPRYKIDGDAQELRFSHFQSMLIEDVNHFRTLINVITTSYNLLAGELRAQRNFNFAIASFLISIVGLSLSLMLM